MWSINDVDSPSWRLPEWASSAAGSGTMVSMGRAFPTSVGAPGLLENLDSILENLDSITGKVRPLPILLIHRFQALPQGFRGELD